MLPFLLYKTNQLHLINQVLSNNRHPNWFMTEVYSFRSQILREIRFLNQRLLDRPRMPQGGTFFQYKSELFRAFKDDLRDTIYAGYPVNETVHHPDTIIWVKILGQVDRFRLVNSSDIGDQTLFHIQQSRYVPYDGPNDYSMIQDHLLNHLVYDDVWSTTISLIVYAFSSGM